MDKLFEATAQTNSSCKNADGPIARTVEVEGIDKDGFSTKKLKGLQ